MSFLSNYKKNERSKLENDAFQYLITDLIQDNLIGYKKTRELSALNTEQLSPTTFIPSMFYIFMYTSTRMETVKGFSFYDAAPLILCTGSDNNYIKGFNFNYIPNNVRAVILDIITESYPEFYKSALDGDGNFKVNNQFGSLLTNADGLDKFMNFVKNKTNVDISKAHRNYLRKNVIKCRMIEYDMWKYIPYLVFKDAVRGVNLADVQLSTIDK